jgi:Tol biopolymer transport system component
VTLSDGLVKKIVSTPGPDTNPQWSPNGKNIAFETAAGAKYYYYTKHEDRGGGRGGRDAADFD